MPISPKNEALLSSIFESDKKSTDTDRDNLPIVVIDTNVLLDIWVWHDARTNSLFQALEAKHIRAVRDEATIKELAEVIGRPQFGLSEQTQTQLLLTWAALAHPIDEELIKNTWRLPGVRCKDPLDQKFIVLARASAAQWLISKDKLVLKAGKKLRTLGCEPLLPEAFPTALKSNIT